MQVEYAQDWLAEPLEASGNKQAAGGPTRRKPARAGPSAISAPMPSTLRAELTGLELESLAADLQSFVPGRLVDDNAHVMLRYKGGARGCCGVRRSPRGLKTAAAARLWHESRHRMVAGGPELPVGHAAGPAALPPSSRGRRNRADAARVTRVPAGHPEGYLEASPISMPSRPRHPCPTRGAAPLILP